MNPAVQNKSSDSFKLKAEEDHWKTTSGKQLGNKWNRTKATGSRQLGGVGVEWGSSGRQLGKNRENTSGTKSELIGRLEDQMCKTNAKQLGDKWETTS